jgi:hypothetical protein
MRQHGTEKQNAGCQNAKLDDQYLQPVLVS